MAEQTRYLNESSKAQNISANEQKSLSLATDFLAKATFALVIVTFFGYLLNLNCEKKWLLSNFNRLRRK